VCVGVCVFVCLCVWVGGGVNITYEPVINNKLYVA